MVLFASAIPLEVCGPVAGAMIAAIVWLAKRNKDCDATNEERHDEVVAITREALTAVADCKAAIEGLRHALSR